METEIPDETMVKSTSFSLPMRDGNIIDYVSPVSEDKGFSLPMRDGNRNRRRGVLLRASSFSLPMRDGNGLLLPSLPQVQVLAYL